MTKEESVALAHEAINKFESIWAIGVIGSSSGPCGVKWYCKPPRPFNDVMLAGWLGMLMEDIQRTIAKGRASIDPSKLDHFDAEIKRFHDLMLGK